MTNLHIREETEINQHILKKIFEVSHHIQKKMKQEVQKKISERKKVFEIILQENHLKNKDTPKRLCSSAEFFSH